MSLLDKKSLYDRHSKGNSETAVGAGFTGDNFASAGVSNADGNYFAEGNTGFSQSPFIAGTNNDHLVDLMTESVTTTTGNVYLNGQVSGIAGGQLDLNTPFDFGTYSGQTSNPTTGQFGGPYIDNCPPGGLC